MVLAAILTLSIPLSFLVKCIYVVYVAERRVKEHDTTFFLKYKFLFQRFKARTRWYAIFFLARNTLVSLTTAVADTAWQITIVQLILVISLGVTCSTMPWRSMIVNWIDALSCVVVIATLNLAALQTREETRDFVVVLTISGFVVFGLALVCGAAVAFYLRLLQQAKQYRFFICHHKAHAGAMARLLKMVLMHSGKVTRRIFVDSDDLKHLDNLFNYVRNETETLVVLCTSEILTRPWCVGEITTAVQADVHIFPVRYTNFEPPSDEWLDKITSYFDFACLIENGLGMDEVVSAFRDFRERSFIRMPDLLKAAELHTLTESILAPHNKPAPSSRSLATRMTMVRSSSGKWLKVNSLNRMGSMFNEESVELPGVIMGVDVTNIEAVAAARIASYLVHESCEERFELVPALLLDVVPVPEEGHRRLPVQTAIYCILFTENCFLQDEFLRNAAEAISIHCQVLPVVASSAFRFPTPDFYEDLRVKYAMTSKNDLHHFSEVTADVFVSYVQQVFKSIAILLTPHASSGLLATQAQELFQRIKSLSSRSTSTRAVGAMSPVPSTDGPPNGGQLATVDATAVVPSFPDAEEFEL